MFSDPQLFFHYRDGIRRFPPYRGRDSAFSRSFVNVDWRMTVQDVFHGRDVPFIFIDIDPQQRIPSLDRILVIRAIAVSFTTEDRFEPSGNSAFMR